MSGRKTINDFLSEDLIDITHLLTLALGQKKEQLYTDSNYELTNKELKRLDELIQQRQQGKPFAYLSGSQGFYHLDFKVSPATLIPRPETELLIDIAIDLFKPNQLIDVIDLGTGSGVIAITLADKCPSWRISATDKSKEALKIAKKNTTKNINFLNGLALQNFRPMNEEFLPAIKIREMNGGISDIWRTRTRHRKKTDIH